MKKNRAALKSDPSEVSPPSKAISLGKDDFNAWDPGLLKQIDALIERARPPEMVEENQDLIRQLIVTALKTENSQLGRRDVKIMARAFRELRYGFRIFKDYRDRRKVTIFGSARTPKTHPEYKSAFTFAQKMAQAGYMAITGAGPGIMQAGNHGAGKNNSFGINIRLPFEQAANKFISKDPRFIDCRFFFTRKLMFLKEASAAVFFPGGFGTHDEAMETLTLVQTGKADMMPLVFIDAPGGTYWTDWQRYIKRHLLVPKKISPDDLSLYKITDSVDEAVREITHFYHNFHSMRFVKEVLIIRLHRTIPPKAIAILSKDFKDICVKGTIQATQAKPEEHDHVGLPRLSIPFDRLHWGRLRLLIDRLNEY